MKVNKRVRRKVDPLTGKPSTDDNAITHGAFKTRERRKLNRINAQLERGVKRRKFSISVKERGGYQVLDTVNAIKPEVSDHKLVF